MWPRREKTSHPKSKSKIFVSVTEDGSGSPASPSSSSIATPHIKRIPRDTQKMILQWVLVVCWINIIGCVLNFILFTVFLGVGIEDQTSGRLALTIYGWTSMRVSNLESFVKVVKVALGTVYAGTILTIMAGITAGYLFVNGMSDLAYYLIASSAMENTADSTSNSISVNANPFMQLMFKVLHYQTVSSGIYYHNIAFFGTVISLGAFISCIIFGLDTIESLVPIFVCVISGIVALTKNQAKAQLYPIHRSTKLQSLDPITMCLSAVASMVIMAPWLISLSLIISLSLSSEISSTPWSFWVMFFTGFCIVLFVVGETLYSMLYPTNWLVVEAVNVTLVTLLNLIFGICIFTDVAAADVVDQGKGLSKLINT